MTKRLDERHGFFIPGLANSKPIRPNKKKEFTFKAPKAGTYMYFDRLNAPVNRVIGLHGCLVSLTRTPVGKGNKFTPYGKPTANAIPQYFTISGQSGHLSRNNPYICPNNRVGEPVLIRILNAGLWSHSMHIHANHVYITYAKNVPSMPNGVQEKDHVIFKSTLHPH